MLDINLCKTNISKTYILFKDNECFLLKLLPSTIKTNLQEQFPIVCIFCIKKLLFIHDKTKEINFTPLFLNANRITVEFFQP